MKVPNDLDSNKFLIHTPLLWGEITFEALNLPRFPLLKIEDWDLVDHEQFPHLVNENYMRRVYYQDSGVTELETVEWIHGVNNPGC